MRKNLAIALAAFLGGSIFSLGVVRSQPLPRVITTFEKALAEGSKLKEEEVSALLNVLGPAVAEQIAAGRQVSLPGLGTFRVVRLEEQRNLEEGRVVTQPATNVIEFLPDAGITQAANAPGAVPALEVPAFKYIPFPGQTPGQKVPPGRVPSTRVR
jgi:nucleoid DNA-binding protein